MNNIVTRNNRSLAGFFTLVVGFAFTAACRKYTPSASTLAQEKVVLLPMPISRPAGAATEKQTAAKDADMERVLEKHYAGKPAEKEMMRNAMTELNARISAEDRLAAINRRTMVTPAPADFKPEPVARKIRLRLIVEKPAIRVGEFPRFRLEMQNVGQATINYQEYSSSVFVKGGGLIHSPTIFFYLTDSRNKRKELRPSSVPRPSIVGHSTRGMITPPSGLSEAEKEKWFVETNAMGQAHSTFNVKLMPGETLHSIGDDDSPVENFKTLYTDDYFYTPGMYELHVELDDRPRPLTKGYIAANLSSGSTLKEIHEDHDRWMKDALGPVSSTAVALRVTR